MCARSLQHRSSGSGNINGVIPEPALIPPPGEAGARQEMFHMGIKGLLASFLCLKGI